MSRTALICLVLYEIITVAFIYRLWTRKHRVGVVERSVLTLVLLVPFLGWLAYAFLAPSPDTHSDGSQADWDNSGGSSNHSTGSSDSP